MKYIFQVTSKENNSKSNENTDRKNQIVNELNESFQVHVSDNEVELNLTKLIPSTSANSNNNNTPIKKKSV